MNNKIFIRCLLLLLTLAIPKSFGVGSCDEELSKNICVDILVNSSEGQALGGMVVYLEPLDVQTIEQSSKEVVIGQQGKSFSPYISVSQVNSTVNFVNQDDITHHIYSAGSNNKFSFKIRSGQTNSSIHFTDTSEIAMGCNIHDWMSGFLLVVNTPYFTKTNEQGRATFKVANKGNYKIVVWHPQMRSENNSLITEEQISSDSAFTYTLKNDMAEIPLQESDDDFDFLSDY